MSPTSSRARKPRSDSSDSLCSVFHESFTAEDACTRYDPEVVLGDASLSEQPYMPDETTRDVAQRMHHAAWQADRARAPEEVQRWKQIYFALRDRIVLGNQKLVYRAVRKWLSFSYRMDDMIGEGHLVLLRAVAAYNPWLGIRFSTYAFTCLMRALSRLTRQYASDWLMRTLALEGLSDVHLQERLQDPEPSGIDEQLLLLLDRDHPLLTEREKHIITQRYSLADHAGGRTLLQVGAELGLSKERVRQVQTSALGKLRQALLETTPTS